MCDALVDMLKANGVKSVAVVYVDDLFGLENFAALKVALQGTGIQIVEDKSCPGGVKDLSPVLRSMKDKSPDVFIGFTYLPDTILASEQAKKIGFNPKFFYASVGTAFQLYKNVMTAAGAEGVLAWAHGTARPAPMRKPISTRTPKSLAVRSRTAGPAVPAGPGWRFLRPVWPR